MQCTFVPSALPVAHAHYAYSPLTPTNQQSYYQQQQPQHHYQLPYYQQQQQQQPAVWSAVSSFVPSAYPLSPSLGVEMDTHVYVAQPSVQPRSLDTMLKRKCRHCQKFFTLDDNESACFYHSGHYRRMATVQTPTGWSCCKVLEEDALGCRKNQCHVECTATAAALRAFDHAAASSGLTTENDNVPVCQSAPIPALQSDKKPKTSPSKLPTEGYIFDKDGNIIHAISRTDTLVGLSLRYSVSVDAIKMANGLMSHHIFQHKHLLIPLTSQFSRDSIREASALPKPVELQAARRADLDAALQRHFQAKAQCSSDEAKAYLACADGDIKKALAEFQADSAWAETSACRMKTRVVRA